MNIKFEILFILLLINISACVQSNRANTKGSFINYEAIKKYPNPTGYVNDLESLLVVQEKQQLDSIIKEFEKETGNQIAIVTITNVEPYESLKDFTTDLGNQWGAS